MLKTLVQFILKRHDKTVAEVTEFERNREEALNVAAEKLSELADAATEEIASSDNRLTKVKKHLSYVIWFKNEVILQITIFNLTDRVELKMNHNKVFVWTSDDVEEADSLQGSEFSDFFKKCCVGYVERSFKDIEAKIWSRV